MIYKHTNEIYDDEYMINIKNMKLNIMNII